MYIKHRKKCGGQRTLILSTTSYIQRFWMNITYAFYTDNTNDM